jgi:hypothetical protein
MKYLKYFESELYKKDISVEEFIMKHKLKEIDFNIFKNLSYSRNLQLNHKRTKVYLESKLNPSLNGTFYAFEDEYFLFSKKSNGAIYTIDGIDGLGAFIEDYPFLNF